MVGDDGYRVRKIGLLWYNYLVKNEKDNKVQPYEKPMLRVIELTADEVMAVGCKTVGTRGPFKGSPPCAPCNRVGS
jgi:hypothetical protein